MVKELYGILLILGATFFYSINSVIVEKLPKYDPLVAASLLYNAWQVFWHFCYGRTLLTYHLMAFQLKHY